MCEYCEEDFDGYRRALDKNAHVVVYDKLHEQILSINWYGHHMDIPIKFCPKCGRCLKNIKDYK